mmetsp:Transcript_18509/g.33424  ORF Transcript_18509/g.33424 Transcript_18509/m.33424 type:complete len:256 (-) Transcript_18509:144-911(-)
MYSCPFAPFSPLQPAKKFKLASGKAKELGNQALTVPQPFKFETEARAASRIPPPPKKIYKARLMPRTAWEPKQVPEFQLSELSNRNSSRIPFASLSPNCLQSDHKGSQVKERADSLGKCQSFSYFKAKKMPDFSDPFKPKLPEDKFTKPESFDLTSSTRAEQRLKFDNQMREKEAQKQQELQAQAELERYNEELELRLFRLSLEFNARPLPTPKQFVVNPSVRPLTFPSSPDLCTKKRASLKCQRERAEPKMDLD